LATDESREGERDEGLPCARRTFDQHVASGEQGGEHAFLDRVLTEQHPVEPGPELRPGAAYVLERHGWVSDGLSHGSSGRRRSAGGDDGRIRPGGVAR